MSQAHCASKEGAWHTAPKVRTLNSEAVYRTGSWLAEESALSTSPLMCFFLMESLVGVVLTIQSDVMC